jgi:hypothetical protein
VLTTLLECKPVELKHYSNPTVLYLLSIFYLELHRVSQCVDHITAYLIDDRNSEILDLVELVGAKIVREHVSSRDTTKDIRLIRQECKSLLVGSTHYRVRVRKFCQDHIDVLVGEYPQILWDKTIVHLMVDLMRFLDSSDAHIKIKLVFECGFIAAD